jgi:prepilin-type N-terminal cleavage/methylation domain-containing protein
MMVGVWTWTADRIRQVITEEKHRDSGFTMLEVMISMTLMTFFMALFSGAVYQMFKVSNKTSALTQSSAQLHYAFERIDAQIRYSSAISPPSATASALGAWYVEFLNTASGTNNCYQLRVYNSQLQERTWIGTPATAPTWVPLASGLQTPTSTPFSFNTAAGSQTAQRLTVSLTALNTLDSSSNTTSQTTLTFEAMNSGQGSSTTNDGVSLVCQNAGDGGRP